MINNREKLIRKIETILKSDAEDITTKSYAITYTALAEDNMAKVLKEDQRLSDIVDLAAQIEGDATNEEKIYLYKELVELFKNIQND